MPKDPGMMIGPALLDEIHQLLPDGSVVLELGSGDGTAQLCERYLVYSVEHDRAWVDKHHGRYIHAQIVDGWYDAEVLRVFLPSQYDLILIDGPPGYLGRQNFLEHMALFDLEVPIVIDDVNRAPERTLFDALCLYTQREGRLVPDTFDRLVGVIP